MQNDDMVDSGPSDAGHAGVGQAAFSVPAFSRFVLHEGAGFRAFSAAEILSQPRVAPHDAFAIWLRCRRDRFRADAAVTK